MSAGTHAIFKFLENIQNGKPVKAIGEVIGAIGGAVAGPLVAPGDGTILEAWVIMLVMTMIILQEIYLRK